jgi:hypothetical protein
MRSASKRNQTEKESVQPAFICLFRHLSTDYIETKKVVDASCATMHATMLVMTSVLHN